MQLNSPDSVKYSFNIEHASALDEWDLESMDKDWPPTSRMTNVLR